MYKQLTSVQRPQTLTLLLRKPQEKRVRTLWASANLHYVVRCGAKVASWVICLIRGTQLRLWSGKSVPRTMPLLHAPCAWFSQRTPPSTRKGYPWPAGTEGLQLGIQEFQRNCSDLIRAL